MTPLQMASAYRSGQSMMQIAEACGKSQQAIKYHLKRLNVEIRDTGIAREMRSQWYHWWNDERLEILRKRWNANIGSTTIAKELGTTKAAVIGKANRIGLPPRRASSHFKLPETTQESRSRGGIRGQAHAAAKAFEHRSLISFPESPRLQALWEKDQEMCRQMRRSQ